MAEGILSLDEAEKKAVDYVRLEEDVGIVEIEGRHLSSVGEILLYEFKGKAKRSTITKDFRCAVIAERSFEIQVSVKDGKILYSASAWMAQTVPPTPQPEIIYCEPVEPFSVGDLRDRYGLHGVDDLFGKMADREVKEADAEKKRAEARLLDEIAKTERQKRNRPLDWSKRW
jgi:hypothetical protein